MPSIQKEQLVANLWCKSRSLFDILWNKIKSIWDFVADKELSFYAASLSFYTVFAIIPLLPYIIKDMPNNLDPNAYVMYVFYLAGAVLSYFNAYKTTLLQADQKEYILKSVSTVISVGSRILIILLLLFIKSFYVVLIIENSVNIITNIVLTIIINKKYPFLKKKTENLSDNMRK